MTIVEAVRWSADGDAVDIIDQRRLPAELVRRNLRSEGDVRDAIATLAVRGAPAIGIAGALGLVVALATRTNASRQVFLGDVESMCRRIAAVRPTAVNLPWAMERMRRAATRSVGDASDILATLRDEASSILSEDRAMCRRIGEYGVSLLPQGARVLTHCNAGALATGGMGTALAPVYLAAEHGNAVRVFVDETRPLMQGSRLTAWELMQAGIDVTVLADSMAASLLRDGAVDLVIVGADRIAANGDVANKVGTYPLALAARHHGIPFYVAAPWSTVDAATPSGREIPIEHRAADEITGGYGGVTAPAGVKVYNPAFDVTPSEFVTAIITDRGIMRPRYHFVSDGHPLERNG